MNYKQLAKVLRYAETTEDDFHKLLDANPNDHHTRMVFADWLQDHNDPRAEGYRALGKHSKLPHQTAEPKQYRWLHWGESNDINDPESIAAQTDTWAMHKHILPFDWYKLLPLDGPDWWHKKPHRSRKEAEDAAALTFAQLPEERRKELLG